MDLAVVNIAISPIRCPLTVSELRTALYPHLAQIANSWSMRLGQQDIWPSNHQALIDRCHAFGQSRPTPLLLSYREGDYNCLHQDLYGPIHFPFQVVIMLSSPETYSGGALTLVENRPRMQSRVEVIPIVQGQIAIIPVKDRPRQSSNGWSRSAMRHGRQHGPFGTAADIGYHLPRRKLVATPLGFAASPRIGAAIMTRTQPKTYSIKNYGCQMNVYDGERMAEMFAAQGMTQADEKANADLVVLNTCHIREKAAEKVYSEIGRLRRKDGTKPIVAVAGCVAQAEGGEISRRAPEVDIVVGPQAYHNLPDMVAAVGRGERVVDLDLPGLDKFAQAPRPPQAERYVLS